MLRKFGRFCCINWLVSRVGVGLGNARQSRPGVWVREISVDESAYRKRSTRAIHSQSLSWENPSRYWRLYWSSTVRRFRMFVYKYDDMGSHARSRRHGRMGLVVLWITRRPPQHSHMRFHWTRLLWTLALIYNGTWTPTIPVPLSTSLCTKEVSYNNWI